MRLAMRSSRNLLRILHHNGRPPVHDFLIPALVQASCRRFISSTPRNTSATTPLAADGPSTKPKRKPLTKEQRDFLDSAVSLKLREHVSFVYLRPSLRFPLAPRKPSW